MKEVIKSALKTKFSNLGLSEAAFDGVATLIGITITEESQIAAVVDKAESSLKGFQADVDRRVTDLSGKNRELEAENLKLKENKPPVPTPPTTPIVGGADSETLELIKSLQETVKGITDRDVQDRTLKANSELMASAKAKMIEKGIESSSCDKILGMVGIAEGETVDTLSEKGVSEYNGLKQLFTPEGNGPIKPQNTDGKDAMASFMAKKAAEKEDNLKRN